MAKISEMPAEILEYIFVFLDGQTLCQSEKVCRAWHEVIKSMKKNNCLWRRICTKEIPESVMTEILSFKAAPFKDPDIIDWILIYRKWFLGRIIKSWPHWKKHIQAFDFNPITCVKHSGSFIVTGHNNGVLCIWNQYSGELVQKLLLHLKTITDIAMIDLLNLGFYGTSDFSWAHHHIMTISKDSVIHISSLLGSKTEPLLDTDIVDVTYHRDVLETIRVFENCFAVRCRDNTVSLWKMKLTKTLNYKIEVSLLQHIIGPPDLLRSIGFWHGETHCLTYSGRLKYWKIPAETWTEVKSFHNPNSTDFENILLNIENIVAVTSAFIFRNKVVILLTADGKMVVSVELETCCYHLMKLLRTLVVSVALFGTILAIGTENGKLLVYHVPQTLDLLNLSLMQPSLSLNLSEASITSIDVSNNEDSPVITACTTESIFVIKWFSQSRNFQVIKDREISSLFSSC